MSLITTPAVGRPAPPPGSRGIDEILAAARARLDRLDPEQAHVAYRRGAVLVDIRPAAQRAAHGIVPGCLTVERNVLEWRFDPRCPARLPLADSYDLPVVVLCQEGYTSSLAAAALRDLGLHRATDVVGGFASWRIAGLPTLGPTPPVRPSTLAPPVTAGRPSR
ncbi:rhodanese-like domain-containing protein [Micromonospora endolithica]|uniref:Sulfurtransferase n=1 Tax=Micromonospora endolithica TaxID=230091 RepID=A0A3A9ZMR4_9ACTN|nr:rhodanese-like domain-containing protein [Micromonospora endolithica]RKN48627.1 sulfurtransferase [Micromonospora endolithica]TWJ22037.1 rhodanese-related sulfurtransferase [Micromonospora endolithica]